MQMELSNEVSPDKTTMINNSAALNKPPSLEQQPSINRARKILIILIGVLIMLCLINFLFVIHSYAASESLKGQTSNGSSQLVLVLLSLIYYGFGFLVTYRYYQTGLLVFAWLGFVSLLLILAVVIVILIEIVVSASNLGFAKGILVAIIFVVICLAASLLQIFAVRYAFRLSTLLKNTTRLTIERI